MSIPCQALADNQSRAAVGYRKANGTLKGSVITQQGGTGVPGVDHKRHCRRNRRGRVQLYNDTTDVPQGNLKSPKVYYGEAATYAVIRYLSGT